MPDGGDSFPTPGGSRIRRLAALIPGAAVAVWLLARWTAPGSVASVVAAHVLLGVVPGLIAWGLFLPRAGPALGICCALALGPAVTLLPLLGGSVFLRPPAFVAAAAIGLALVATLSARRIRPAGPAADGGALRGLLPLLIVLLAVVAIFPLTNEWWRVRSDAWFHAAFALEVRDFGVPPQDPFFAGSPLRYFWMFHLYLAGLCALASSSPFPFFCLINLQALAALIMALYLLSARFRADATSNRLAALCGVLGLNALFWVFLPLKSLRALVGKERGMEEIARIYDQFPIDLLRWIDFLAPLDGAQPFFLSKFYVGSAFSIGLALMPLLLLLLVRRIDRVDRGAPWLLALGLAALWAYHPDFVLFLVPAVGAALLLGALAAAPRARREALAALWPVIALAAVVSVLFLPYVLGIAGEPSGGELLDPNPRRALAIALSGTALLLLAAARFRELWREHGEAGRFVLLTGAALVGLALLVRLPGSERAQTMDKNPYFLALGLALPAGWAWADLCRRLASRWGRRGLTFWASAALLVPANAAMLFGYSRLPARFALPPEEAAFYEWVRRETPRDAVFLQSRNANYKDRMRLSVLGPRRVYAGALHLAGEWGYPAEEVERRRALEESLFGPDPGNGLELARELAGRVPVYLLQFREPGAAAPVQLADGPPVVYDSAELRVWAVAPGEER